MLDFALRIITIFVLLIRSIYWYITARKAQKEKPGHEFASLQSILGWLVSEGLEGLVFIQLLQLVSILPISAGKTLIQLIGFVAVCIGTVICIHARQELGVNWSHAADYQIKKGHTIITTGIYQYVRHPIYLGLALSWIGAEMVAGSWLWVSFLALFFVFYIQGKREEKKFLASSFGNEYKSYMKQTKMLIPFVL